MPNLGAPELLIIALIVIVGGGGAVIAVVIALLRARARPTPPPQLDPRRSEPDGYVVHQPTPPEQQRLP